MASQSERELLRLVSHVASGRRFCSALYPCEGGYECWGAGTWAFHGKPLKRRDVMMQVHTALIGRNGSSRASLEPPTGAPPTPRRAQFAAALRRHGRCTAHVRKDILVTGYISSTLGDSLNRLLPVLALASKVGGTIGPPWLSAYQWRARGEPILPHELTAHPVYGSGGIIELGEALNLSRLAAGFDIGPSELCYEDGAVAVQLWKRGHHSFVPSLFRPNEGQWQVKTSRAAAEAPARAPEGLVVGEQEELLQEDLRTPASFDALVHRLQQLQRGYVGAAPMVVHMRMDGFPEMSCAHWALAPDILRRVLPFIELRRPSPSLMLDRHIGSDAFTDAAIGDDALLASQAAYVFFRSPSQHALPTHLLVSTADHRGLNSFPLHGHMARVPADDAAEAMARVLRAEAVRHVFVDLFVRNAGPNGTERLRLAAALHEGLRRRGITVIENWRALPYDHRGRLPGTTYFGPSMATNLHKLYLARHAKVLITERGSQWGDLISMLRAQDTALNGAGAASPTYFMHARKGEGALRFEPDRERCVRVRGQCARVDDRLPYNAKGYC